MNVLETDRLILRWFESSDAPFVLQLLNDPGWLKFIGDRGVRTIDAAEKYLERGPIAMYAKEGLGLYLVERKRDGEPIGMCGLIKRAGLDDIDIGFAFLPPFCGQGYAHEAAQAVMAYARKPLGLRRIVAITDPRNTSSIRLLEKIGFAFEKMVRLNADDIELMLFAHHTPTQ